MAAGKTVDAVFADGFVAYLRDRTKTDSPSVEELFDPALPPPKEGFWREPESILHALTHQLSDDQAMYLHHPRLELLPVARMIAEMVGHKAAEPGDPLDADSCVRRGEAKLARTAPHFALWLLELIGTDYPPRLVMNVIYKKTPIGVSVVLPLKEGPYHKLCRGLLHHSEIRRDDLDTNAGRLFIFIACDPVGMPELSPNKRSRAQLRTLWYQLAYFSRYQKPFHPSFVAVVSHPGYELRARHQGFVKTGACEKGTSFPVMVLGSAREMRAMGKRLSTQCCLKYEILCTVMRLFRAVNRRRWRKEDETLLA